MNRRIAVIDAETDPFKPWRLPKPFIWGFYDGEQYRVFRKTEELAEFLQEYDGIVYAHNGGKFDWHYLLPYATAWDGVMIINGRIAKMFLGDAECRDSMNILPVPLSAYEKDKIDYAIMEKSERNKPKNKAEIEKYLKSDCVNLWTLVMRFIDEYGLKLTQAGAAMKMWRKISDEPLPVTNAEFYDAMAKYYYGGRVECFKAGIIDTEFSVYDINSAYPYAMLEKHPYSANYSEYEYYREDADFYTVRCISRGAFPYRSAHDSGLQFPNDSEMREYHVTKWELQAALETNTIEQWEVTRSIVFVAHRSFEPYVNHYWNLRKEAKAKGDKAGVLLYKLILNSLYGKFASNPANYMEYMIMPQELAGALNVMRDQKLETLGWTYAGDFGPWGLAQTPLPEEKRRYYNVATGASITGYVRAMLWRALCGSKGALYCDTDSISVVQAGNLSVGDSLGMWKHEGVFNRAGISGKKLYIFRGARGWYEDENGQTVQAKKCPPGGKRLYKQASKGVRLTPNQLWAVAKGAEIKHVNMAPTFSVLHPPLFIERTVRVTAKSK